MGASSSQIKSATEITKEVSADIMKSSSAKCAANTAVSQNFSLRNVTLGKNCIMDISGINQKADVAINLDCRQVQDSMTDIQNKFNTAIDNKFKADAEAGVGLADASIDIQNKIKETIKTKFDLKQLAECVTDLKASQNIDIGFTMGECDPPAKVSIGNINQTLFAQNNAKCVQEQFSKFQQENTSGVEVSNEGEASSKGMNMDWLIWVGVIVVVILLIVAVLKSGILSSLLSSSSSRVQYIQPQPQYIQPQPQYFQPQPQFPAARFNDGLKYF